jgi:predicted HTH domain antitoxin
LRGERTAVSATQLEVELPSNLSEEEAKVLLAVKLYEVGKASLGQAARLAGYSARAFIEVLGHHKVPVFNYSAEELRQELDS